MDLRHLVHLNLLKMAGAVLGYFILWKVIFYFFDVPQTLMITVVSVLLALPWLLHRVEWAEESSFSIFGVPLWRSKRIRSRLTILQIIPISATVTRSVEVAAFPGDAIAKITNGVKASLKLFAWSILPLGPTRSAGKLR